MYNLHKKIADLTEIIHRLEGLKTSNKGGLRVQIVQTLKFARSVRAQLNRGRRPSPAQ